MQCRILLCREQLVVFLRDPGLGSPSQAPDLSVNLHKNVQVYDKISSLVVTHI